MKKNVILCDFIPNTNWSFIDGVNETSGMDFEIMIKESNKKRSNTFQNLIRYIKYFFFSFKLFLFRKKYNKIIAWQQFYGLLLVYFCRLFHVKKDFDIYIMTFIYKPKRGLIGKVYRNFIKYVLNSKYIDRIIVFSSSECEQYSKELDIDINKFIYVPLGEDLKYVEKHVEIPDDIILASGFSNRDFDFLRDVCKDLPYKTYIFGKKKLVDKNIMFSDQILGDSICSILQKTKIVAVPLKENRSSGQLTILHAFFMGVPVIATNTDAINDYIIDGFNGFICDNDIEKWREKIELLYNNPEIYEKMKINCKKTYIENHTLKSMGNNIGIIISK